MRILELIEDEIKRRAWDQFPGFSIGATTNRDRVIDEQTYAIVEALFKLRDNVDDIMALVKKETHT
jgi:hypothetical protein